MGNRLKFAPHFEHVDNNRPTITSENYAYRKKKKKQKKTQPQLFKESWKLQFHSSSERPDPKHNTEVQGEKNQRKQQGTTFTSLLKVSFQSDRHLFNNKQCTHLM